MTASLSGEFNTQAFTDAGAPAAGYRLYTYTAGTTTHKPAYTDAAAAVPHTYTADGAGGQYIALNARGELPAPLFLTTGAYDLALKTLAGATVWTRRAQGADDALRGELLAYSFNLTAATVVSGGGTGTPYSQASFLSSKLITTHAWYGFAANDTIQYAGGAPIYGHASFNDNVTLTGGVDSDHHHSFQSDPHYSAAAVLGVLSSFWSQIDATAGTVNEATGVKVNNPTGAGTITNHYGVWVDALTRATNNWGAYLKTKSFVGAPLWLGAAGVPQAFIEYSSALGHVQVQPRPGFGVKIGAAAGDRLFRLGDPTTDAFDAVIENRSDGDLGITPRSGFKARVLSALEATGPIQMATYTVATVPAAATYPRGMIYVSNEAGGATPAFSDATNWRRVADRAVIS